MSLAPVAGMQLEYEYVYSPPKTRMCHPDPTKGTAPDHVPQPINVPSALSTYELNKQPK